MYVVYALEDPRDHLYHYIGITNDVYARFVQHLTGQAGNISKTGWIFECRQANVMILMRELERVPTLEEAKQREQFWIGYYLHLGHPLLNKLHAKSLQDERNRLEEEYQNLLEVNAKMEKRNQRLMEVVMRIEEASSVPLDRVSRLSPTEAQKVFDLREKGLSLRSIAKVTGYKYNQVQRLMFKRG